MKSSQQSSSSPSRALRLGLLGVALAVIAIDQLTKIWAQSALGDGQVIKVLGDFLSLRLVYNPGAALSIANGQTWLITIVVIAVSVGIVKLSSRLTSPAWVISLALVLGGGVGNLIDRLFRAPGFARGHVIDFIDYNGWFVGNVADIAIVGGAAIAIGLVLFGIDFDGTKLDSQPDAAAQNSQAEAEDD